MIMEQSGTITDPKDGKIDKKRIRYIFEAGRLWLGAGLLYAVSYCTDALTG